MSQRFSGIADSEQLALLTKVLNDFCHSHGIGKGPLRDEAAKRLMDLYLAGSADPQVLADRLDMNAR